MPARNREFSISSGSAEAKKRLEEVQDLLYITQHLGVVPACRAH